jgi:5-carboxymethyl-2-hydroxymuconate isomerase
MLKAWSIGLISACKAFGEWCSSTSDTPDRPNEACRCTRTPEAYFRRNRLPHIVCHYSAKEEMPPIRNILLTLHRAAAATTVVKAEDLKIRAQGFDDYLVAGEARSFFHVSLYLLEGRMSPQKQALSVELRRVLIELLPNIYSISVDIRDMDPEAYKKRLNE